MKLSASALQLIAAGIWMMGGTPLCAQQTPTPPQIYQLLSAQQFVPAEKAAVAYLIASPNDCKVRLLLGLALRGQQKFAPALDAFKIAATQCPTSIAAVAGAAETAFLLNSPDAGALVSRVIELLPNDPTGYAMMGALDARAGDCAGAVDEYAHALDRIQQNAPALRQYGGCLLALDRAPEAIPVLTQLLALNDDVPGRLALAQAQAKVQPANHAPALATLQPLLASSNTALVLASQFAEADNNTPQAVTWLRKAIAINPKDADAYLAFAEISFAHGAYQVGVDFLTLGLEQLPGAARLFVARGVLEVQLAHNEQALADFQKAHRLDPHLSFADDAIGMLSTQKHDPAMALALFAEKSRQYPNDALLQYIYAESLSEAAHGDPAMLAQATMAASRAVKLEPDYQPARDLLCTLLLRSNDLEAVVTEADEALHRDPFDEVAIYQEMLAQHKLKHEEKSAALVKQLQTARAHNQQGRVKYLLEEEH
jgi:tetratricopeptide (TPR) repeat protein